MSCNGPEKKCEKSANAAGVPQVDAEWAAGRRDGEHCPKCGGYMTEAGGCNRCGKDKPDSTQRKAEEGSLRILEAIKECPTISTGYRVPSGYVPTGTATQVIDYEQDELGNDIEIPTGIYDALRARNIPARDLVWVTELKRDAVRYAGGDESAVEKIEFAPGSGSVIIGKDGDGGVLVWKNALPGLVKTNRDGAIGTLKNDLPTSEDAGKFIEYHSRKAFAQSVRVRTNVRQSTQT